MNCHSCFWLARSLTHWAREMDSSGTSEAGYRIKVGVVGVDGNKLILQNTLQGNQHGK